MRGEIEEAERREEDWDRFYEAKRKEMEEFQVESRLFLAETREEVQRLRDSVSQVWSRYFASINYDLLNSSQFLACLAYLQLIAWHLGETGKFLLILFAWLGYAQIKRQ